MVFTITFHEGLVDINITKCVESLYTYFNIHLAMILLSTDYKYTGVYICRESMRRASHELSGMPRW